MIKSLLKLLNNWLIEIKVLNLRSKDKYNSGDISCLIKIFCNIFDIVYIISVWKS